MYRFRAWLVTLFTPEPPPLDTRRPWVAYVRLHGDAALQYLNGGDGDEYLIGPKVEVAHRFDSEEEANRSAELCMKQKGAAYCGSQRVTR